MKTIPLSASSAILAAMGVILSWSSLRFPGTIPAGFKLLFLSVLILLWLVQTASEIFSRPLAAGRLNLFSTGFAAAFYALSAIESFRLCRNRQQPGDDFAVLAVSMAIAVVVIVLSLTASSVRNEGEK